MTDFRSPLGRAKGLGSAQEGSHHFWLQRLTAVFLIPLTLWLGIAIAMLPNIQLATLQAWVAFPVNAALLTAFLFIGLHHANLGLQVILQDYIAHYPTRLALLILLQFTSLLAALVALIAVIKLLLSGV